MKRCITCGESKEPCDFWKNSKAKDGLASSCKPCVRAYKKSYYATDAGKAARVRTSKAQIAKDMVQQRSRRQTHAAIKAGRLVRGACEVCGDPNTHAHHDDYNKPLDVRWLCPPHHQEWHNEKTPIYATSLKRNYRVGPSGVRGVTAGRRGGYQATINYRHIGTFPTIAEAAAAIAKATGESK